jgi:hypothetical protein
MKKILLLLVGFGLGIAYADLTQAQIRKLNSPLIAEHNGTLVIEEYYKINLQASMNVPFDDQKHTVLIQKSSAHMKKGTINPEQFIAMYSAASDQITQEIFMPLLKFGAIRSVEYLTTKPKSFDVENSMYVTKSGVKTIIKTAKGNQERFVPFEDLFLIKIR